MEDMDVSAGPRPGAAGRLPSSDFWRGRRVLLTGHTGFKGGWAALWLARLGAEVTGIALPPEDEPNLFSLARIEEDVVSCMVDITDHVGLSAVVERARPEIVIHMAAQPLVRRSLAEPVQTFATNVMGTAHLLDAIAKVRGCRAVLVVTSDKVYRNDGASSAFDEQDPLGGDDPYSASKAATELVAHAFARSGLINGARLGTARGGNVIGGGDFAVDRIVPDTVRAMRAGEAVVLRHPDARRPWQHVLDCLAGYLLHAQALAEGNHVPSALNFGPEEQASMPVSALVDALQAALGVDQGWRHQPVAGSIEKPALALSSRRAREALGWHERFDQDTMISETAAWYRAWANGADMRAETLAQIERYVAMP